MTDKRSKMHGTPVSNEEVMAALGRPSPEWARLERHVEFRKRLASGETELGIKGIRGYGTPGSKGYLGVLHDHLLRVPGVGTGLVPDDEDATIREAVLAETTAEIAKYEALIVELEKSPEAVATYVGRLRWWLNYLLEQGDQDPEKEIDEEMAEMVRLDNKKRVIEITALTHTITQYETLERRLRAAAE